MSLKDERMKKGDGEQRGIKSARCDIELGHIRLNILSVMPHYAPKRFVRSVLEKHTVVP